MWQRQDPYSLKFCTTLSFQVTKCWFQSILLSRSTPMQYLHTVNLKGLQEKKKILSKQLNPWYIFALVRWTLMHSVKNSRTDRTEKCEFSAITTRKGVCIVDIVKPEIETPKTSVKLGNHYSFLKIRTQLQKICYIFKLNYPTGMSSDANPLSKGITNKHC